MLNYFYRKGVKEFWLAMNKDSKSGPERLAFLEDPDNSNFPPNYTFNGHPSSAAITKDKLLHKLSPYADFRFEILDLFGSGKKVCIRWKLHVLNDSDEWLEKTATNIITFSLMGKPQTNWQTGPHVFPDIAIDCFWFH